MGVERAVFLATALATHGAVGYALVSSFTAADPRLGALFALAPDVDFLLRPEWGPLFVHRGITHTPTFALAVVASAYAVRRRRSDAAAVSLAVGSHLAIDALSPMGLPLLVADGFIPSPGLDVHGPVATLLLWALVVALVRRSDGRQLQSGGGDPTTTERTADAGRGDRQ